MRYLICLLVSVLMVGCSCSEKAEEKVAEKIAEKIAVYHEMWHYKEEIVNE